MADRAGRRPRGNRRGSWDQQIDPLPKRERARKRIETPAPPPLPPLEGGRRKLSPAQREQLRERYTERHTPPPSPPRQTAAAPATRRRWSTVLFLGLIAILIGSVGAGRYFGNHAAVEATATATATATAVQIAAAPSVTITLLTPTATPTETPTITPSPTPTVTPSPTPNPAFIGKVICLDPGHGGLDRGFTRAADDIAPAMEEANVTLALAKLLKPKLEAMGFTVVMTRTTDTDVNADFGDANGDELTYEYWKPIDPVKAKQVKDVDEYQARIFVCNRANADLLVSMHINGYDDQSADGFEVWYSSARSFTDLNKRFAQIMFDELGKEIASAGYNARARGVKDDADANAPSETNIFDRYVMTGPAEAGKIVPSAMPGAIVETLFLSNDQDAAFLASDAGQAAIVNAYAIAIARYFDELTG